MGKMLKLFAKFAASSWVFINLFCTIKLSEISDLE